MFLVNRRSERARLEETWREAARLVSCRWALFLAAQSEQRQRAFASYLAALDAEEAAADAVAYLWASDCRQAA